MALAPVVTDATALQEFHVEMEREIIADWDWIASLWVPFSAVNEPPGRPKLSPGLVGSCIQVVEE